MTSPDQPKGFGYIAYIDEAGDFGLRTVAPIDRRGASEWLIVSAVVIRATAEPAIVDGFRRLRLATPRRAFLTKANPSQRQVRPV